MSATCRDPAPLAVARQRGPLHRPALQRRRSPARSSPPAEVKITEIGCKLRHHHDAGGIGGVHDVARIDQADAGAALDGGGDGGVVELRARIVDGRLSPLICAPSCATSAFWVSTVCLLARSSGRGAGSAACPGARSAAVRGPCRVWRCAEPSAAWKGRGSICASSAPLLTSWPSVKPILSTCPSTRAVTVTV